MPTSPTTNTAASASAAALTPSSPAIPNSDSTCLPPGHFFKERVRIFLVKNGQAEEIAFDPTLFDYDPNQFDAAKLDFNDDMRKGLGWSGFRLRYPINSPDYMDEFAVFQGASYFRAIARDTLYGLSARGLALGTGGPGGEEFPRFTQFWIYQRKRTTAASASKRCWKAPRSPARTRWKSSPARKLFS